MQEELEQCGAGLSTKKSGTATSKKTLASKFIEDNSPVLDLSEAITEAQKIEPALNAFASNFRGDLAEINGIRYERSGLDRSIGLVEMVATGNPQRIKNSADTLVDSLRYQSGAANTGEVPPIAVRGLMVSIPAVLPHMTNYQAKSVLSAFPLNKNISPPTSGFARSQSDIYYRNIKMAQAQALKVLESSDPRAFKYAAKQLNI